jgi:FkbH-like protein
MTEQKVASKNGHLTIVGTSFLLDKHPAWQKLGDVFFRPYGTWYTTLAEVDDRIIFIIFTEDFYTKTDNSSVLVDDLITIIKTRVTNFHHDLIVAVGRGCKTPETIASKKSRQTVNHYKFMSELHLLAESSTNLFTLDIDSEFANSATEQPYSVRNWYHARCRFSIDGLSQLTTTLHRAIIDLWETKPIKVLALDCDNTLWQGVVGEDGLKGIKIGIDGISQAHKDFQNEILKLKDRGIVIVLLSKNSESDVLNVFNNHAEMLIRMKDVTDYEINWNSKAIGLQRIAVRLQIHVSDFMFWDDNPIERNLMRELLPMVTTPEIPKDPSDWIYTISNDPRLNRARVTSEDLRKADLYRARKEFVTELDKNQSEKSVIQFLSTIKIRLHYLTATEDNLQRIYQLNHKTNQFNTSLRRYTDKEILELTQNESNQVILVRLVDKYADHGLVGLVVTEKREDLLIIENFALSCRVLGRNIEAEILRSLTEDFKKVFIDIRCTPRNEPARNFFAQLIDKIDETIDTPERYRLDMDKLFHIAERYKAIFNE